MGKRDEKEEVKEGEEPKENPTLVMQDSEDQMFFAHVVQTKGVGHDWVIDRVVTELNLTGHPSTVLKCDQ